MADTQFEWVHPKSQSNVVRLPTAAPRKVKQPHFQTRAYYRAVGELPRHPAEFRTGPQRRAELQAAVLMEMDKSAALVIASAIFQAMDEAKQAMVLGYCTALAGTDEGRQASAWLSLITANYGTSSMVKSAMRLAEELGQ